MIFAVLVAATWFVMMQEFRNVRLDVSSYLRFIKSVGKYYGLFDRIQSIRSENRHSRTENEDGLASYICQRMSGNAN